MSRKRPTPEQLGTAAEWLLCNEDTGDEGTACHTVAVWLDKQAETLRLQTIAKEIGVPLGTARKALAKASAKL